MNLKGTVWVIDDDHSIRWVLEKALQQTNLQVKCFSQAQSVIEALNSEIPDIVLSDIRMPGESGINLLKHIKKYHPNIPVIIMTAHSDLDSTLKAYQGGAFEYLPKPFDIDEAITLIKRAYTYSQHTHTQHTINTDTIPEIIGQAPAMQQVFRAIGRLSQSNISVLINGESGTGKELVAKALHKYSPRNKAPFIALNMAAIPKELIESELFGHEKGAFTGASNLRQGRFEQANGGTLFLDEIGDMPAEAQTRLLRVLAQGEFHRIGGKTPITVDVRIIAATHQPIEKLVKEGHFREDLFHRLNVIRIHIPKLADRAEDIPALIKHFLTNAAQELSTNKKTLTPKVENYLKTLPWPGNVRQLENTCRWLTVMASGHEIHMDDLPPDITPASHNLSEQIQWPQALQEWIKQTLAQGQQSLLETALPLFEKTLIETALQHTQGKRQEAAILLGWGRNTLSRKIKELHIQTSDHTEN